MTEQQPTDWSARFAALRETDGEEWDCLDEKIETDWKREYRAAFVEIALSRGWERESAKVWVEEIVDDACASAWPATPRETAEADVRECEMDAANAC